MLIILSHYNIHSSAGMGVSTVNCIAIISQNIADIPQKFRVRKFRPQNRLKKNIQLPKQKKEHKRRRRGKKKRLITIQNLLVSYF